VPFVAAGELQVHYVEYGRSADGNPPTAVLLHGFTADHHLMTGCFEPVFAKRPNWRRLYLDLPGMGRTRSGDHIDSTDAVLAVVRDAIGALVPRGGYVLCGQSYGGYLARGLVAEAPERVRGMALICPMLIADHAARDVPEHSVLVTDPDLTAQLSPDSEFSQLAVVQNAETFRRTQDEVVVGIDVADESALDRIRQGWAGSFAGEAEGSPFGRPVLIVTGGQDSSTGHRDAWPLLNHYPRATLAVLDRAGHNAQIEQPQLFDALVHEWLDRVDETAT
jgi:pimeloyl-ACP methyl ester carboxylesterase